MMTLARAARSTILGRTRYFATSWNHSTSYKTFNFYLTGYLEHVDGNFQAQACQLPFFLLFFAVYKVSWWLN